MESKNRFRALIQNGNDITPLTDPAGWFCTTARVFSSYSELLGVSPEQRLGYDAFQWIRPDDLSYIRMLHEELLRAPGTRLPAQLRVRHADGSWRWCDSWAANLLEEPGVLVLEPSSRDITETKSVKTPLRESYRNLIEGGSDVIFTIDPDGNFNSVNTAGQQISRYRRQELLSMNLQQLTATSQQPRHVKRAKLALA